MVDGRVHDRFEQFAGEVRIVGAGVVRQRSWNGVVSVFGRLHPDDLGISLEPTLAAEAAAAQVARLTGGQVLDRRGPELVVLPLDEGGHRLAWRLHAALTDDVVELFVDAHSGSELRRASIIQTQSAVGAGTGVLGERKKMSARRASGVFLAEDLLRASSIITLDLRGDHARAADIVFRNLPPTAADRAADTDNAWTDGAVVDAHNGLGVAYDYFHARFNRRGIDGANRVVWSVVHPATREFVALPPSVFERFVLNAFWCPIYCGPGGAGILVFGEGMTPPSSAFGRYVNYYSAGFDIVAHEYSHAVTSYSSDLIYYGESGALSESFADIMAVGAEHYAAASGRRARPANYVVAEDVFTAFLPGLADGLRSFADPGVFGQPDHYASRYVGPEDNGGVHWNSGIPNHAFYLAIEGGTHRASRLTVQGVGAANREQIERIFYRALTVHLFAIATFQDARAATLLAAVELYGADSDAHRAVRQAWTAVGVE